MDMNTNEYVMTPLERILDTSSTFYYRLFGSAKLRAYETACLDAWKKKLSRDAVNILNRQFELYDYVQRQSKGKLVCFFYLKDETYKSWPKNVFFPLRAEEAVVATVRLRPAGGQHRASLRANMTLFRGRFYSIEFNKIPKTVFKKGMDLIDDIEVTDVKIIVDPMAADIFVTEPLTDTSKLKGWLRDWVKKWKVGNLRKPLSANTREKLLRLLDINLPPDYLELITQTEGLKIEHCDIHGLSQIRTIILPKTNLYILAEIENRGALGVNQGEKKNTFYYLDNEDDRPEAVGVSFQAAIEKELQLAQGRKGNQEKS